MFTETPATPSDARSHTVQFYREDEFLISSVTAYLESAARSGEPCVVIATREHREALESRLRSVGVLVDPLMNTGQMLFADARETLATFMRDGRPHAGLFDAVVGSLVRQSAQSAPCGTVRAYGEMVDLLWRDGNRRAALELEELWNVLRQTCEFSLLCAYALDGFLGEAGDADLLDVCRCHHQVEAPEGADTHPNRGYGLATRLQMRTAALQAEITHRRVLEETLRNAFDEQRRAETAAHERQQELTDFVENAAEGLHWVGPDGRIIWANAAELELVGRQPDEYVGHHISEFHADAEALAVLLGRLQRGETVRNFPARLTHKDGSIRHALITSNVFRRNGEFVHTRCFTRDVSELRETQEQLERAIRARDEFISIASHELRNPVHVIQLQALGLRHALDELPAPARALVGQKLSRLGTQISRLGRLLDNLLDVSRLHAGRLQLEPEDVDLAEIVRDVLDRHREELPDARVDVESCPGWWDRVRLDQIVSNLVSNAIKFGERRPVSIRLAADNDDAVLEVQDRGIGVAAVDRPLLFQRFERLSRKGTSVGFGLGLWITREIVIAMGGTIDVESEVDQGSCFTVRLPRGCAPVRTSAADTSAFDAQPSEPSSVV